MHNSEGDRIQRQGLMAEGILASVEKVKQAIRENRAKHSATFAQAVVGWESEVTDILSKAARSARRGDVPERVPLPLKPQDYTSAYDKALSMLEFSVEDKVHLTAQEVDAYINDNWRWKGDFVGVTSNYIGKG